MTKPNVSTLAGFLNKNIFFIVHFDKYYFISNFTKANLLETKRNQVDRYNIGIDIYVCHMFSLMLKASNPCRNVGQ
jgi:hypothetical protein